MSLTMNEQIVDGVGADKPVKTPNEAFCAVVGDYKGLDPNSTVASSPRPVSTVQPLANIKKR